jgi:hypothetical protein
MQPEYPCCAAVLGACDEEGGFPVTDEQNAAETALRCISFVELITAYLDDTLPHDVRRRVDEHLRLCEGSRAALSQSRTSIRTCATGLWRHSWRSDDAEPELRR